ncbi:hypothetical protein DR980_14450 [Flavobacterium psychrolimnae]|uniref:Uncharacterized protein n=1 Tax=Flavobacterium psychrolimnae TaxID=249351 RepID=A0A366AX11_9FLAO|nr:hypothetical protein DR980_14450 [Flavobacterium psychrolimnae]
MLFFNTSKKRIIFPNLAPVAVKILFLFSLKRKRLQRKTGTIFLKSTNNSLHDRKQIWLKKI